MPITQETQTQRRAALQAVREGFANGLAELPDGDVIAERLQRSLEALEDALALLA